MAGGGEGECGVCGEEEKRDKVWKPVFCSCDGCLAGLHTNHLHTTGDGIE